ncbi:MAG: glycosyltransferase family 39 protein, partial [Polyangiaceae bacterium]|nr:glycosyltransferase family 39 protein [Polyangiaceae bacterium]
MSVLAKITIFIRQRSLLTRLLLLGGLLLVAFTAVASIAHLRPTVTAPVYIALVFPLVGLSLRRLRLDVATTGIVLAGLALYLVVLGYTSIGERNFDGGEQLAYIEYIIKNRALPPASHCLICHHPPTYYVVGAAVHAFFRKTRLASPVVGLQLFSILIFLVFLTAAILTLRRFARTRGELRLGAALVVFWPYSIQNSVRLHNDTLVYAWMALAFYFIVAWSEGRRPRDLYLAGLFSALGVATKTSAIAMVALLLLLVGARLLTGPDRPRLLRRAGVVAALLAAAMSMNGLLRAPVKARATAAESGLCQRVLGSACNVGGLLENEPYNYVYLDVQSFLKEPYLLSDRDETGRQLFWNHLLKSSLFATHNKVADAETAYRWNRRIAGVMNALLLGMTAFLGFAALAARREAVRRYALPLGAIAISMAFMLGFRILLPVPHHTDFRHVYHL